MRIARCALDGAGQASEQVEVADLLTGATTAEATGD